MNLKTHFPKASKSFLNANPHLCGQIGQVEGENAVQTPLRRGKGMNKTEREYSFLLEAMRRKGDIESYKFEGVTLKLADGCRFTPDFFIVVSSMILRLRFCEIKGAHIWEDSLVKFKVAKEQFPWAQWQMWRKERQKGGQWTQLI